MADASTVNVEIHSAAILPVQFRMVVMPTILLPEPALLCAGALGGPLCIGALTPLRNACTLASQDKLSTVKQIYGRVFSRGIMNGWTGASTPAVAAAIQFTTLGPGYFVYLGILGSPVAAVAAGAVTESFIVYGPNTRNAQLVHNMFASDEKKVKVRPFRAMGPGFTALVLRNSCASAGIRVLSTPFSQVLACFSGSEPGQIPGICRCGGDFLASVVCGAASMPFNQLLNFQVTSAECLASSPTLRLTLGMQFLKSQYLVTSGDGKTRLSRMVLRDGTLRALYIGLLFSSYAAVERAAIYLASR